jgi:threonine aldolase
MLKLQSRDEIQRACTRFFGHAPRPVRERLLEIAHSVGDDEYPDRYGAGALAESFESEIAQLLGKEAAVFMPSGTMAQQIALRIHCEHRSIRTVALHPQSHLLVSENNALERLQGLQPIALGDRNALFSVDDLQAVADPIGAVLLELPERNIGGALRPWPQVEDISNWARARGAAIHLDGARLWETQPFYGMPLADIAAAFDTVYVSFYKILNAVAGAALAGPAEFIREARVWQWRHGGRLVQQYPMIVSARAGLQKYLPRIPSYCEQARSIAAALESVEGVAIAPNPPVTNMMHLFVRGEKEAVQQAALRVSEESKVWIPACSSTQLPDWQLFELSCAEGSLGISAGEVRELFASLVRYAAMA